MAECFGNFKEALEWLGGWSRGNKGEEGRASEHEGRREGSPLPCASLRRFRPAGFQGAQRSSKQAKLMERFPLKGSVPFLLLRPRLHERQPAFSVHLRLLLEPTSKPAQTQLNQGTKNARPTERAGLSLRVRSECLRSRPLGATVFGRGSLLPRGPSKPERGDQGDVGEEDHAARGPARAKTNARPAFDAHSPTTAKPTND